MGLAAKGYSIIVLSPEKAENERLVEEYGRKFDELGIGWHQVPYRNTPPVLGHALTQLRLHRAARDIMRNNEIRLVHARSYTPALIAYRLHRAYNVPYIFDIRHLTADEGLLKNGGLRWIAARYLKWKERFLVTSAARVVCLTERVRSVLNGWYFDKDGNEDQRFSVIPCCADFSHFDIDRCTLKDTASARRKAGLDEGALVLLYLGSLGPDYDLPSMIALFRQLHVMHQHARFLFVSNNGAHLVAEECRRQGIDESLVRFVSAGRDEIPAFLALADLSVIFYYTDITSAGRSPAKLAELFACNVPVIANAGVGDLDKIIDLKKNGSVIVGDYTDGSLRQAVSRVLETKASGVVHIRENSRTFSLDEGVSRYDAVYRGILN